MDSDEPFKGFFGGICAILMLVFVPVALAWCAIIEVMRQTELDENRILAPSEKPLFYALGVYAVIVSILGILTFIYGLFLLISWSASLIS